MYQWLMCIEYSTQGFFGDGLVEFMPEHICHVMYANVEAIPSDCKHQEDEFWEYCKIGKMCHYFVHTLTNNPLLNGKGIHLELVILFCA